MRAAAALPSARRLPARGSGGRLRALSVFGTRPEAIKMAPLVRALGAAPEIESLVCVTGQHRQLLDGALAGFGIEPDYDLDLMRPGQELVDSCARVLGAVQEVVRKCAPDAVLVQGDTTSAFGAALAAAYCGVPVLHVEAGLRTGDPSAPFPEELNRALIDRLAWFCFAPTRGAAAQLAAEGIAAQRVAITGNTGIDALLGVCAELAPAPRAPGAPRRALVTCHRRENFGAPLAQVCEAVRQLAGGGGGAPLALRWVLHPNPEAGAAAERLLRGVPGVELVPPLGYRELVQEMLDAELILTDSGGIQEEAPALGRPVLVLRELTERGEGIEAGVARLVGTRAEGIVAEARRVLGDPAARRWMSRRLPLYGDGAAAERIRGWLSHLAGFSAAAPAPFGQAGPAGAPDAARALDAAPLPAPGLPAPGGAARAAAAGH